MSLTLWPRIFPSGGLRIALLAAAAITVALPGWAASGDAVAAGRDLFAQRCVACHSLKPTRKPGPPLAGVYGRRAGSVTTYHYSAALKSATVTWNAATLDRWLSGPPAFIPGVNMQAQVDSEQDRQNLIAYLKSLSRPVAGQNGAPSGGG
jgi:cytochrome c2